MRRTVFVVPVELAAIVQASSTRALVPVQRKLLIRHLAEGGVTDDGERWLRAAQDERWPRSRPAARRRRPSSRRTSRRCARS